MGEKKDKIMRIRELAKQLFLSNDNLTQKEIAERIGTTEQSVSRWARAEGWAELRQATRFTKANELKRLYAQLTELNDTIAAREKGFRYPSSKEVDIQRKMGANIAQLENRLGITEIVRVSEEIVNYYRATDIGKAKAAMALIDEFVQAKLKGESNV